MAEKKIGKETYRVGLVLARKAINLQLRMAKLVGPAVDKLPEIMAGMRGPAEQRSQAGLAAAAALMAVIGKADQREAESFIVEVCEIAEVMENNRYRHVIFDEDFTAATLFDAFQVMIFVLGETFGDFFTGLQANGARPTTAAA